LQEKKKKYSQRELAEILGVPQSYISNLENGKINPTLSSMIEIARALGFELMLIPKISLKAVEAFTKGTFNKSRQKPAYSLDEDEDEE
jgi:transcriptional regulator with XRE-family HTH domain